MTNGEKIRMLSNEQLSILIHDGFTGCDLCDDRKQGCAWGCKYKHGIEHFTKWLNSESEG